MSNTVSESNTVIGRTYRNDYDGSTGLSIPKEFAKALDIESSKVSMSIMDDFEENKHLVVTKHHTEIIID